MAGAASHPSLVQFGKRLSDVKTKHGLPDIDDLFDELIEYGQILLARADSPVNSPYLSLMEVAAAYYARACEIEMLIFRGEHTGDIDKGSAYYKFRTGELRSFKEMAKMMADVGSRRLTQEDLISRQRYDVGDMAK